VVRCIGGWWHHHWPPPTAPRTNETDPVRTLLPPPSHPRQFPPPTNPTNANTTKQNHKTIQALLAQLDHEIIRQGSLLQAAQSDAFGSDDEEGEASSTSPCITLAPSATHHHHQQQQHHFITPLPSTEHDGDGGNKAVVARHFLLAQQARLAAQLEVRNAEAAAYVEHRCVLYNMCWVWGGGDGVLYMLGGGGVGCWVLGVGCGAIVVKAHKQLVAPSWATHGAMR
jgi:hypothetical protein